MLGKLMENKKKVLCALAVLATAAVLLAVGIMTNFSTGGGDEASAESSNATEATDTEDTVSVENAGVDNSDEHAAELFACKVDNVENTASVASLLETMGVEELTGKYAVHIAEKDDARTLTFTMELPVKKSDADAFNANMEKYAQQMLALIPQLDKVEWIYSVNSSGSNEEQGVGSIDDKTAEKMLGSSPESFGKSERAFGKLLAIQAE